MKRKFFSVLLIVLCLSFVAAIFSGCLSDADYEAMYDDDTKIASGSSEMMVGAVEMREGGNYEFRCSSLSGVHVGIKSFKVNKNKSAHLSFKVEEGKCKAVLTDGKTVYTLAEGSFDGALDFSGIPEGEYKFKIVGVKAEFKMTLKY